ESTGTRYIKVYQDRASAYDAICEVQQLKYSQGGWSCTLIAQGDLSPITDWARVLLYTEEYWGDHPGKTDGVQQTIDVDPASVVDGSPVGRYDPHILFNGI